MTFTSVYFFPKKNCRNVSFYYGAVPWYHNNHHSHISGHPTPQRAEVSTTSILDFSKLDKPHWQSELGFKIPLGWVNFLRSFSADSLDLFYHKRDTWIASWCHTIKTRVGWFWSSKIFFFSYCWICLSLLFLCSLPSF